MLAPGFGQHGPPPLEEGAGGQALEELKVSRDLDESLANWMGRLWRRDGERGKSRSDSIPVRNPMMQGKCCGIPESLPPFAGTRLCKIRSSNRLSITKIFTPGPRGGKDSLMLRPTTLDPALHFDDSKSRPHPSQAVLVAFEGERDGTVVWRNVVSRIINTRIHALLSILQGWFRSRGSAPQDSTLPVEEPVESAFEPSTKLALEALGKEDCDERKDKVAKSPVIHWRWSQIRTFNYQDRRLVVLIPPKQREQPLGVNATGKSFGSMRYQGLSTAEFVSHFQCGWHRCSILKEAWYLSPRAQAQQRSRGPEELAGSRFRNVYENWMVRSPAKASMSLLSMPSRWGSTTPGAYHPVMALFTPHPPVTQVFNTRRRIECPAGWSFEAAEDKGWEPIASSARALHLRTSRSSSQTVQWQ
ncbi:hypothetical protein BKA70DRAFT_1504642 [Coprinopsis sp. MPI-PUGE-AT-0042]|nr:hypothetical protein BKA70DRAFT_1504642 [Coprinopsis sp. MPI-PUGE-AT-0042]